MSAGHDSIEARVIPVSDEDKDFYGDDLRKIKYTYRPRVRQRQEAYQNQDLAAAAVRFQGKAKSTNTNRTYDAATKQYLEFCRERGFEVLPGDPEAVRQFLVFLAIRKGRSVSTIKLRYAGLRRYYRDKVGRDNVTNADSVRDCLKGIIRELAEAPVQAPALRAEHIRAIVRKLPVGPDGALTLASLRDRALLLVMYSGAFRRSEAAGLLREDVVFEEEGFRVLLRSSKGDQTSQGQWVGIGCGKRQFTCPSRALQAWFDASPGCSHLFHAVTQWEQVRTAEPLNDKGIGRVVKRLAHIGGLDPDAFSAHSLRAGVTTDLNAAGMPTAMVQERTRHRSANMVGRYHRPGHVLKTNFTRRAGL